MHKGKKGKGNMHKGKKKGNMHKEAPQSTGFLVY